MGTRQIPVSMLWGQSGELAALQVSPTAVIAMVTASPSQISPATFPTPSLEPVIRTESPAAPEFSTLPPGKIVYTCFDGEFDQICLMNADGANQRQLTDERATSFYPSLSSDGEWIVFSSNRDGNFEIYLMYMTGENLVQLTDDLGGNLYAPEISPKNNRIAFTYETSGLQSIWVMKLDGGNARALFESSGSDIDPTWSPDASRLAFVSAAESPTQPYTVNSDGSNVKSIIRNPIETGGRIDWSPDGLWLAFYSGARGDRNLFTIGLDGKNLTQWTWGGDNLAPSFSPDGEWLTYTSFRDGNNEIYLLNLKDQQAYRLTFNPNADWQPRWGP